MSREAGGEERETERKEGERVNYSGKDPVNKGHLSIRDTWFCPILIPLLQIRDTSKYRSLKCQLIQMLSLYAHSGWSPYRSRTDSLNPGPVPVPVLGEPGSAELSHVVEDWCECLVVSPACPDLQSLLETVVGGSYL